MLLNPSIVPDYVDDCQICGKALTEHDAFLYMESILCRECLDTILAPIHLIEEKDVTKSRIEFFECA